MSTLLDAALGYAARGIPVYPIHWPRSIPGGAALACSCPRGRYCDRPAKHPLVWHGVKDASRDPAQLHRWWQRWPDANIGLATGVVFDALDVDGLAGMAALREHVPTVGRRHPGPLVATGGGGWHYWYAPSGFGNRPPRGLAHVDWRGLGGSVLAPPSRHVSGGRYRWLRTLDHASLPEVPAALRALLEPSGRRPARARRAGSGRRSYATPMRGRRWPPS
jgi:Bifunctional DNA primase/polymerase, N-terminal